MPQTEEPKDANGDDRERLKYLISRIEGYDFECEAGSLANCAEWVELKERLQRR